MPDMFTGSPGVSDAHDKWVGGGDQGSNAPPPAAITADPPPAPAPVSADATTAATAATVGAEAAAAAGGGAEGEAARAAAIQEFLEGQLDGKPYQVPKGLQLPYKRGKDTVYRPVDEVLRLHANYHDLQGVKARAAERERELGKVEYRLELERRQLETRRTAMEEEYQSLRKAFDDPEEGERLARHRELLATDPQYKKMYDDSLALRERDSVASFENDVAAREQAESLVTAVDQFVRDMGAEFPGIDPDEVVMMYGNALKSGDLKWPGHDDPAFDDTLRWLVPQQVRSMYQRAQEQTTRIVAPVQQELATLREELAALKQQRAAEDANDKTRRDIQRSRDGRFAAPAAGAPPAPAGRKPREPYTSEKSEEARSDWASRRD